MLYSWSWWDLPAIPLAVLGIRALWFKRVVGQRGNKEAAGYFALFSLYYLVTDVIRHRNGYAVFDAALFAYWVYEWWNSGGGDMVKNLLQSLVMKPAYATN